MRSAPYQIEDYSVISFYPELAAVASTRFGMLCNTHGDGDAYTWQEGGGAYAYTIQRLEKWAEVDGWQIFNWEFKAQDTAGEELLVTVDCIDSKLLDADGYEYSAEITNRVFRAILDAAYEIQEKDKIVSYFTLDDGSLMKNPGYSQE